VEIGQILPLETAGFTKATWRNNRIKLRLGG
jgi:hypothetical protein